MCSWVAYDVGTQEEAGGEQARSNSARRTKATPMEGIVVRTARWEMLYA